MDVQSPTYRHRSVLGGRSGQYRTARRAVQKCTLSQYRTARTVCYVLVPDSMLYEYWAARRLVAGLTWPRAGIPGSSTRHVSTGQHVGRYAISVPGSA
eukprot:330306-Rhodomonas_salina.1